MSPVSEKNMREQTELFYHHFSCSSDLSFETPSTAEPISVGVNVYNYTVYSVAVTQIHKQRRRKSILIFMDLVSQRSHRCVAVNQLMFLRLLLL